MLKIGMSEIEKRGASMNVNLMAHFGEWLAFLIVLAREEENPRVMVRRHIHPPTLNKTEYTRLWIIVTEVRRTRPRQHRRWTAHIADTGEQIVPPDREPEFRACLALHHGVHGERYDGPVKFYRPGEAAPYLLVASAGTIARYEAALTPVQMFEVMVQETSDHDRARLIATNSMTAWSCRIARKPKEPRRPGNPPDRT
jgi:hypothetical protein